MPEFRISSLRFNYVGAWATTTTYNRDAVVTYGGKMYVCLVPHTSGDFYQDLAHVTGGGASTPYWNLLMDGHSWTKAWAPSTYYQLGNIATYGGAVYICTTNHISATTIDLTKFNTLATYSNWNSNWTTNKSYGQGDIVKYGGIVYVCNTLHTSAATAVLGLEANLASWTVINNGVDYKGAWTSSFRYKLNDLVKLNADVYICTTYHTSTTSFDNTKFTLYVPGQDYMGTWSSGSVYQPGDIVNYGGYEYISVTNNNTNNIPSTDAVDWTLFNQSYIMQNDWNNSTSYKIGSVVRRNGNLFAAKADSTGQDPAAFTSTGITYTSAGSSGTTLVVSATAGLAPGMIVIGTGFISGQTIVQVVNTTTLIISAVPDTTPTNGQALTFVGINYVYWNIIVPGINWASFWTVGTAYVVGDVVVWQNGTYRCVQNHTAAIASSGGSGNNNGARPDQDTTNTYWTIYTLHARHNAGASQGDLVTSNGTANIPVNVGTNGYTLKVTGSTPSYYKALTSTGVYYVSSNGIDRADYGTTWDQPWKTIRYACNFVGAGTQFPNTNAILVANKAFIQQEILQWMLYQVSQNISPFSSVSTWNYIKTVRDTGFILDSILYDLTRGGNSQTVAAALAFFAQGSAYNYINSTTAAVMPYIVASLNYAYNNLLPAVIAQTPITSYQATNNILSSFSVTATATSATGSQVTVTSTALMAVNQPIQFSGTTFGNIIAGTTYYVSTIVDATHITLTTQINGATFLLVTATGTMTASNTLTAFSTTVTATSSATNRFTVTTTAGITQGQAVQFTGNTFGGITYGAVYYVTSIVDGFNITIGTALNGTTLSPTTATGTMTITGLIRVLQTTGLTAYEQTLGPPPTNGSTSVLNLLNIINTALSTESTVSIPPPNTGLSATIFVKTGTYRETLPITIPENVALVGDELRGAVVQPNIVINTITTLSNNLNNTFTVYTTAGMYDQCPVQFVSNDPQVLVLGLSLFDSAITAGQNYYVIGSSITSTAFSVSATPGGSAVQLAGGSGYLQVVGGDAIRDMFYMRNGSGLRNMTLVNKLGTLTAQNAYQTQRPTGGAYVGLDPGAGPNDTTTWIFRKSPYVQNVTTFGQGSTGLKIDGSLHNGGNKSIVCNDFTQVISDGIGIWCTNSGALCEAVSVFSYYGYAGYFAENGGRIRATNGNSSYGTYGVIAEGYDTTEIPITASVNNQYQNSTAVVAASTSSNLGILRLTFSNSGTGYNSPVTNIIQYSNNFLGASWTNDGNVFINQNQTSPNGNSDAWTIQGLTSGTDSAYIQEGVTITPTGQTFNTVSGSNITGSGSGANFNVAIGATAYTVTVNSGGSGYVVGNTIRIFGSQVGGINGTNDVLITVTGTGAGSSVSSISTTGTVPAGSAQNYIVSLHVKQGTSASVDLYATFTGNSTRTSAINYNFNTNTTSPSSPLSDGGLLPTQYGTIALNNGWYRIWMAVYDTTALNSTLTVKVYPRTRLGSAGTTYIYGSQIEFGGAIVTAPGFYQTTITRKETGYADFITTGAGVNVATVGNEIRSGAVFQTRVTDTGLGVGGNGYLTSSNNAQAGNAVQISLSQSDTNTATNYIGMRVFITAGTGAGQYGFISNYNSLSKVASILKESFTPALVTASSGSLNLFNLDPSTDVNSLYLNQPIQFLPNYYNTTVTATSTGTLSVIQTTGGTNNYFTVYTNTSPLTVGMAVTFSGTVFGGVITSYTYYITNILSSTTFQISSVYGGAALPLNSSTGSMTLNYSSGTGYYTGSTTNMTANMPIQFSGSTLGGTVAGTLYYVQDVIDSQTFTISTGSVSTVATGTNNANNQVTVNSITNLVPMNPIYFSGTSFGNIVTGTKYYIASIPDSSHITLASTLINVTATATSVTTNLVTCSSTAGFVSGQPIIFSGNSFGNISAETVYYVLAINDAFTFTISNTVAGSAVSLFTATGQMFARTTGTALALTTASGSMTGATTANKFKPSGAQGSMNALFQTPLFGNVVQGTTYYILSINAGSPNTISITATNGGSTPVSLTAASGSMQFGWVGWDNVNPGTAIASLLDSTSLYYIEPRLTYSAPAFSSTTATPTVQANGSSYVAIAYGNNTWIAVANANSSLSYSTDGATWSTISLPISGTWSALGYGANYWCLLQSGSITALVSNSSGQSWRQVTLPASTTWSSLAFGNGTFIAVASGTANSAYSTNGGITWTAMSGLTSTVWKSITYGAGTFVAIAANGSLAYINTQTTALSTGWTISTLPGTTNTWASVTFGNGIFVAIASSAASPVYSTDGVNWSTSPYTNVYGVGLAYGQGVFVSFNNTTGASFTSEDGNLWTTRSINAPASGNYGAIAFGFTASTASSPYKGQFIVVGGTNLATIISAGARAKARPNVSNNVMASISMFEAGSGYTLTPGMTVFDPNVTTNATFSLRTGSGSLASPTFLNRGLGYQISSTNIYINGSGIADNYQTGLYIYVNNLSRLARPGDDMVIAGNSQIYKVTSCVALYGTVAPSISALVGIAPSMTSLLSPAHATAITIREQYSQVRLTNHDFLSIGYGDQAQANYPGQPVVTGLSTNNQTVENNYGRVFFTSTDQDGNFKVGNLFGVQQATGTVTLSASQFGLSGLSQLALGGISVGGSSVTITQFSTDQTFVANSDSIIPTQRAIRAYLTARLSQGGSNTFTGQATAGTVVVGGPNFITSTIPAGTSGSSNKLLVTGNFYGAYAGVDGGYVAMQYFINHFTHR